MVDVTQSSRVVDSQWKYHTYNEMILIKQHNSHEVAHLYEHLFGMAVDDLFYDHKLFPYLDYEYVAKTIRGVLYFSLVLHTIKARRLKSAIYGIRISVVDETFYTAIIQLSTELKHNVSVVGNNIANWNAVREELLEIDKSPWQKIDDVDIIEPKLIKLIPGSLYIPRDKTALPIREISVRFAINGNLTNNKELLPLYSEISELMSENVRADLYSQFGLYSIDVRRDYKNKAWELTHIFNVVDINPPNRQSLSEAVENSLIDLRDSGAFQRLTGQLRNADFNDTSKASPGVHHIFKQTGLLVGEKGWQRIATTDNCDIIRSNIKVILAIDQEEAPVDVSLT